MGSTIKLHDQGINPNFENVKFKIRNAMSHVSQESAHLMISLNNNLTVYSNQIEEISNFASSYDSLNGTEGNGLKSFIKISQILIQKIENELDNLETHGNNFFLLSFFLSFFLSFYHIFLFLHCGTFIL